MHAGQLRGHPVFSRCDGDTEHRLLTGRSTGKSMVGTTVSHYKILQKIGEGGMGVVYKAEDTRLLRPVALKFLAGPGNEDAVANERFAREARAAGLLSHPNIATIYEYDEVEDPTTHLRRSFIAMEFVEGETLKRRISRGSLTIAEACGIFVQVVRGLNSAHEHHIVHRDIKPSN